MKPGAFQIAEGTITINEGRETREVAVKTPDHAPFKSARIFILQKPTGHYHLTASRRSACALMSHQARRSVLSRASRKRSRLWKSEDERQ